MENLVILNLMKLLSKKGRKDLAELLQYSYSKLNETTTYGSRLFSYLTTFEIYSPIEINEKLNVLSPEDKQVLLENIKLIYPTMDNSPEIIRIEFFPDVNLEFPKTENEENRLTRPEIFKILKDYIGNDIGYFSFNQIREFYLYYCDLDINPDIYNGNARQRFMQILEESDSQTQVKILKGILKKYTVDFFQEAEQPKKQKIYDEIQNLIKRLEGNEIVESPKLNFTNEVVSRAIKDAKTLIEESGATSGVDRIHTALHGYLRYICSQASIEISEDESLTKIFKKIRANHPSFIETTLRKEEIDKILNSLANILDAFNPLRNKASFAHPNDELLNEEEAMLVINTAHTILYYLNSKIKTVN